MGGVDSSRFLVPLLLLLLLPLLLLLMMMMMRLLPLLLLPLLLLYCQWPRDCTGQALAVGPTALYRAYTGPIQYIIVLLLYLVITVYN